MPITPNQVRIDRLRRQYPAEVIDLWNSAISQSYRDGHARITDKDMISLFVEHLKVKSRDVPDEWLDVAPLYRLCGWDAVRLPGIATEFNRMTR
jgi:hypothetical protein